MNLAPLLIAALIIAAALGVAIAQWGDRLATVVIGWAL